MSSLYDYAALIKLLVVLKRLPDAVGETTLTPDEAAHIRLLGFAAEAGNWKVPPLPPALVRDNPVLEPLSVGWDHRAPGQVPASTASTQGFKRPEALKLTPATPATQAPVVHAKSHEHKQIQSVPRFRQSPKADPRLVALVASKIKAALQRSRGEIAKRRLQQRFWRYGAATFDQALRYLLDRGVIRLQRI